MDDGISGQQVTYRDKTLSVDLQTSTDVLERQAVMSREGLSLSERRQIQQTHTKIFTAPDHKSVVIQDSANVNLSLGGGQCNGTMDQCILEMKIWKTKEVFAETSNFVKIGRILESEGHLTLSGASGEGKTSIALMLGMRYKKHGYDIVVVDDVDRFRLDDFITHNRKLFFIFEDILGNVGLGTDVPQLRRILSYLKLFFEDKDKQNHQKHDYPLRIVFTTKTYNLLCGISKLGGQEFFFFKGHTVVDLTRMKAYKYSYKDKEKIFDNHKKRHGVTVEFSKVYDKGQTMFGFPLTCELFFEFHAFQKNPEDFFREPLFYLRRELQRLLEQRNEKSAALILMLLCDRKMDLMHVENEFKNTNCESLFTSVLSLIPNVIGANVASAARNFRGTFFTMGDVVGFSHPTISDACACVLFDTAPKFVLENCPIKFLHERLMEKPTDNSLVSDHLHKIYVSDSYNSIIARRLARSIAEGNYRMSITHPILKKEKIVDEVFVLLRIQKTNKLDRILGTDKTKMMKMLHSEEDGKHLLYWTVHSQSLYLVQKLFELCDDFSEVEITEAFEACACCGNLVVMKFLLPNFTFIKQSTILGALTKATDNNYPEMVKYLLDHCHDVTMDSQWNKSHVLVAARKKGYLNIEKHIISCISKQRNIAVLGNDTLSDCNTILQAACGRGDMQLVKYMIPVSNINSLTDGLTPLMKAVVNWNMDIFYLLLSKGADLTKTDNYGNNILHHASLNSTACIVEELLPFFDINIRGQRGLTPVMQAAIYGKRDTFLLLVSKGADLTLTDDFGDTVLHCASQGGNTDIVGQLLPLFHVNIRGQSGLTPLMIAALGSHVGLLEFLVSEGADHTTVDNYGDSVFHFACGGDNIKAVEDLLPLFDINIKGQNGLTPLMTAARNGNMAAFHLLASNGADMYMQDYHNNTVIHHASYSANADILQYVLPLFDINCRGQNGWTPVMIAAVSGQKKIFVMLVSKGADLTLTDNNGDNTLHLASQGGDVDIVEQLLPLVDVNIRGQFGLTPVLTAACCGREDVFELLVDTDKQLSSNE